MTGLSWPSFPAGAVTYATTMEKSALTRGWERALAESEVFQHLPVAAQDELIERASLRWLADGECLFHRGDPADGWYCLLEGALKVSGVSAEGRELALIYLEPGSWFGEISLFDGMPRTHDNYAHGDCVLLLLPKAQFRLLLQQHSSLYEALMQMHCQRLRMLFAAIEDHSLGTLEQRLLRQLRNLARSYGVSEAEGVRIDFRISQEGLAQLVGGSRQRVNLELKRMEGAGLLLQRGGQLILRKAALAG